MLKQTGFSSGYYFCFISVHSFLLFDKLCGHRKQQTFTHAYTCCKVKRDVFNCVAESLRGLLLPFSIGLNYFSSHKENIFLQSGHQKQ